MPKSRARILLRLAGGLCLGLALAPWPAEAAVAKISGIVLQVTHRPGAQGQWQGSYVGTQLPAGSRVRTAKRSACEIVFPDGSRVRMGPRSDLVITDPGTKRLKVVAGQVFANILRGTGGAQFQGATATAAVKGTWVMFQGPTMEGVYPQRDYDTVAAWDGELEMTTAQGTETLADGQQSSARPGERPTRAAPARPWAYASGTLYPWWWQLQSGVNFAATPGTPVGVSLKNTQTTEQAMTAEFMGGVGDVNVIVQGVRPQQATAAAGPLRLASHWSAADLLALAALGQSQQQGALGQRFFTSPGEWDLAGVLYNGGGFLSAWGRGSAARGHFYGEVGLQSLTSFSGSVDSMVSDAFLVYRNGRTEVTAGRQRYLEGPVNNSVLGSLFRSLHFDGASVKHTWPHLTATAAWINDYDTYLPNTGHTGGWLGRLGTPVLGGTLGVNALQQRHEGWGWSADLALPVWRGYLDGYAEVGTDPEGRRLSTLGVYLPRLYQSAGIDLFLEYAQRHGFATTWSALAYIESDTKWTGLVGARNTADSGWEYTVGGVVRLGNLAF